MILQNNAVSSTFLSPGKKHFYAVPWLLRLLDITIAPCLLYVFTPTLYMHMFAARLSLFPSVSYDFHRHNSRDHASRWVLQVFCGKRNARTDGGAVVTRAKTKERTVAPNRGNCPKAFRFVHRPRLVYTATTGRSHRSRRYVKGRTDGRTHARTHRAEDGTHRCNRG